MTIAEVLSEMEDAGVTFRLDGEKVRVSYPDDERRKELAGQIALLRSHRADVAAYLKARGPVPHMPKGVRLVRYVPKTAPVHLDVCSVIFDVPLSLKANCGPWTRG